MDRRLVNELLDELPANDPRAARSRADLRRINVWMGNHRALAHALGSRAPNQRNGRAVTELGAGDGTLLLRVARRLGPSWKGTSLTLVDRQALLSPETQAAYAHLGWHATGVAGDAGEWLRDPANTGCDVLLCNLFLHHLALEELRGLLRAASAKCRVFVALEPRRSRLALLLSHLVGLLGCNAVTRHDAVVSVRAGFTGNELSRCWPNAGWRFREQRSGHSGHLFIAERRSA